MPRKKPENVKTHAAIARLRTNDVSAAELADAMAKGARSVQKWLRGEVLPEERDLIDLLIALGLDEIDQDVVMRAYADDLLRDSPETHRRLTRPLPDPSDLDNLTGLIPLDVELIAELRRVFAETPQESHPRLVEIVSIVGAALRHQSTSRFVPLKVHAEARAESRARRAAELKARRLEDENATLKARVSTLEDLAGRKGLFLPE